MPELRPTRIQVSIKANYVLKGSPGEGSIVDISAGGIGLSVRQIFVVGDLVRVTFKIPNSQIGNVDFWGIVRNVNNNTVGLKYEEISKENMEKIDDYVASLLEMSGRKARESY